MATQPIQKSPPVKIRLSASIDPVTRIEGHMKVDIAVDTVNGIQQVVEAKSTGTLFRGFEKMLIGRNPRDGQNITERICGVCPTAHSMAAVLAMDAACKVTIPTNARVMRNITLGANFLDSHILHFYLLSIMDFVSGPAMPPWQPSWNVDKRFSQAQTTSLVSHYLQAVDLHRKAQELAAIFGGRMPHPPSFLPGGITAVPKSAQITQIQGYLTEISNFITQVYIPDVELLAAVYQDYFSIGVGNKNLIAYGVFDLDSSGSSKLLARGRIVGGAKAVSSLDVNAITEYVNYSWMDDSTNGLNPANGLTTPVYPKGNAYSWMKAPRYEGAGYEAGPLARMWVNGDYRNGVSVMDRHRARAYEAAKVCQAMMGWVNQITIGGSVYTTATTPATASTIGLTEAPRGALGHWLQIGSSKITRYQVITPTCWSCSPRDNNGKRGPMEQALIGTPVQNIDEPVEVMRVIHSYDPCLDCAVHVTRPGKTAKVYAMGV